MSDPSLLTTQTPVDSSRRGLAARVARLCLLASVLVVALLPLTNFLVEQAWWVELFSHFAWHGFWAAVVLSLAAFALKSWRTGALGVVAILGCAAWSWDGAAPAALVEDTGAQTFCVSNILTSNRDHARVRAWLEAEAPDGAFFVEVDDRWSDALSRMTARLPHITSFPRQDNFGVAGLTRAQPKSARLLHVGGWHALEIMLPGKNDSSLRVLVVHPLPPVSRDYATKRNAHMRGLGAHIASSPMPTVVLGDFNMTPWSPYYRSFVDQAKLARARPVWGRGATWPSMLPGVFRIPIDHVLVSEHVRVSELHVGQDLGSDHLPVCVKVSVRA